jgi:dTDP-4-dehydrorhamnose reductase
MLTRGNIQNYQADENISMQNKGNIVNLVIGKDGYLGRMLFQSLKHSVGTSRRVGSKLFFDLKSSDPKTLPEADVVYIVAAKTKFRDCEIDDDAWSINVDGPIGIGSRYSDSLDSFVIYISSEAAEWSGHTAYGDQKRFAEMGLRAVVPYQRLAIVRPSKVTTDRIEDLCKLLLKIGSERLFGVHRFK